MSAARPPRSDPERELPGFEQLELRDPLTEMDSRPRFREDLLVA